MERGPSSIGLNTMPEKSQYRWTKPYYGVSHCETVMRPFQATVEAHEEFTVANWFNFNSLRPFTPDEKTFCGEGHTEAAKLWLEARYRACR